MDEVEVIELLKHSGRWNDDNGQTFALVRWANYDQALTLLRQKPKAGEFTKEIREFLENCYMTAMDERSRKGDDVLVWVLWDKLFNVCNLLDAKDEEIEKLKDRNKRLRETLKEIQKDVEAVLLLSKS